MTLQYPRALYARERDRHDGSDARQISTGEGYEERDRNVQVGKVREVPYGRTRRLPNDRIPYTEFHMRALTRARAHARTQPKVALVRPSKCPVFGKL